MKYGSEFLERVLSGPPLEPDDIKRLVQHHVHEDQWIEFKRSAWLERPTERVNEYETAGSRVY